jgi:hypothetical protein
MIRWEAWRATTAWWPLEASQTGSLKLTWRRELGLGGDGSGCQVGEIWLMEK